MAHYKKDGSLDMRFSSSRQASSSSSGYGPSPSYQSSSSSYSSYGGSSATASNLHYKKDGSLDMRYSSSKQAATPNLAQSSHYPTSSSSSQNATRDGDLHFKKDGTMDMRYSSSKQAAAQSRVPEASDVHRKKDGSLDMRYSTSQAAAKDMQSGLEKMHLNSHPAAVGIPSNVPIKKDGTPDMRMKAAKEWVAQQAAMNRGQTVPTWVPRTKDGSIDINKALGRAFRQDCMPITQCQPTMKRKEYWQKKRNDNDDFNRCVLRQRDLPVYFPSIPSYVCSDARIVQNAMKSQAGTVSVPANIPKIDYSSLVFGREEILGKGAFGVVVKATWRGTAVAVKKLHLAVLTKRDILAFTNELSILSLLGKHENLVFLHGYCLEPLCIVMELVELGSISYLLHYCDKPEVEAKMTDGRVKACLIFDIVNGMRQLHVVGIVHGDIKPQNILVTKDYRAKVSDFGLATLRGKTSSTVDSRRMITDDDDEEPHLAGGTAGYMAPELLDSTSPPDYPSDVYSFGILLNEIVSEEEPYSDQYQNFAGRGPFAAVNYAKQGKRPTINKETTSVKVQNLIERCWASIPASRPTFDRILEEIRDGFGISHSF